MSKFQANAVIILNVGQKSIHPKSRESIKNACDRWNCDLIEITESINNLHVYWQKCYVCEKYNHYNRILQLDGDMLIRWNAPNPFDIVPKDKFGIVLDNQLPDSERARQIKFWRSKNARIWADIENTDPVPDQEHLNAGLLLYNTKQHQYIFDEAKNIGLKGDWHSKGFPEQTVLSMLLKKYYNDRYILSNDWNCVSQKRPVFPKHTTRELCCWIGHFTGPNQKNHRINGKSWQPTAADSIIERLPHDRINYFAEIGVNCGYNSNCVMHFSSNTYGTFIDNWGVNIDESYILSKDKLALWNNQKWINSKNQAITLLDNYHDRINIIHSDLHDAAKNNTQKFDLVYLDADHSYEGTKKAISSWMPHVNKGGYIGGHDYDHPMDLAGHWGVKKAVRELFDSSAIELGHEFTWFVKIN
jgi:hypothetical protein